MTDPRMTRHRPVPPPAGVEQNYQLDPPCERPERIIRILKRLDELEKSLARGGKQKTQPSFLRLPCVPVSRDTVTLVHPGKYFDELRNTCNLSDDELHALTLQKLDDDDVYFHNDTFLAATLACGGVVGCVDAVLGGGSSNSSNIGERASEAALSDDDAGTESPRDISSFCPEEDRQTKSVRSLAIVRPPGHHACQSHAMGFCFLNSVAVAAKHALATYSSKCKRVLILDWDIHHGNGTQDLTFDDPNILYVSLHRFAKNGYYFFPGTGKSSEVGFGEAEGSNLNIAWECSDVGNTEYAAAFSELILPLVSAFDPSLIMVSCGFDAAKGDLIGDCSLSPDMYHCMTKALLETAGVRVPTVVALEGGYNLDVIANCCEAVALALLDKSFDDRVGVGAKTAAVLQESGNTRNQSTPKRLAELDRKEVPLSSDSISDIGGDQLEDISMSLIDFQDPSSSSFNESTLMESMQHLVGDGDESDTGGIDGDDKDGSGSASSSDIDSSPRQLKVVDEDTSLNASNEGILPNRITHQPLPTAASKERLRAGRVVLSSLWNCDAPSPRMKGMGAKNTAIRNINQSIGAIRSTRRWRNPSLLPVKEILHQNDAVPIMQTRSRRGYRVDPDQAVAEMNQSMGEVSLG